MRNKEGKTEWERKEETIARRREIREDGNCSKAIHRFHGPCRLSSNVTRCLVDTTARSLAQPAAGTRDFPEKSNFHRLTAFISPSATLRSLFSFPLPPLLFFSFFSLPFIFPRSFVPHRVRLISRRSNVDSDDRRPASNFKARTSHYRTFRFLDTASSPPPTYLPAPLRQASPPPYSSPRSGKAIRGIYFCNSSTIGCRDQAIIGYPFRF